MEKALGVKVRLLLFKVAGALTAINYAGQQFWHYPVFYCWLSPHAATLYAAFGMLLLYLAAGFTIWQLVAGRMMEAFKGFSFGVFVIELPAIASSVFGGGSCG